MPDFALETSNPRQKERVIAPDELPEVYRSVSGAELPVFTWNDLGDDVLIVVVGDDWSLVTMKSDETFYNLVLSDDESPWEVEIVGGESIFPAGARLPRELGLEVLLKADDFARLKVDHMWQEQ
jgi:hypothetical protein